MFITAVCVIFLIMNEFAHKSPLIIIMLTVIDDINSAK